MRHYEVVAVIHPDQQGRIAAMIDLYKKIVADGGGVLHRLEDWGRRPLAYPIQNQHKAQYVLMNIECGNETLDQLREIFRFSDFILRSLIIRREQAVTEPSVMMTAERYKKQSENGGAPNNAASAKTKPADAAQPAAAKAATTDSDSLAAKSAESAESTKPAESAESAKPAESAESTKSAKSAESTKPAESVESAKSAESAAATDTTAEDKAVDDSEESATGDSQNKETEK